MIHAAVFVSAAPHTQTSHRRIAPLIPIDAIRMAAYYRIPLGRRAKDFLCIITLTQIKPMKWRVYIQRTEAIKVKCTMNLGAVYAAMFQVLTIKVGAKISNALELPSHLGNSVNLISCMWHLRKKPTTRRQKTQWCFLSSRLFTRQKLVAMWLDAMVLRKMKYFRVLTASKVFPTNFHNSKPRFLLQSHSNSIAYELVHRK